MLVARGIHPGRGEGMIDAKDVAYKTRMVFQMGTRAFVSLCISRSLLICIQLTLQLSISDIGVTCKRNVVFFEFNKRLHLAAII